MLAAGATAPDIVAADLDGQQQTLATFLARSPVLIAFFKISCPTCQFTFPFLQRMADGGAPIIGISQDEPESTRAFVERFGIRFPVLLDRGSDNYQASNAYRISRVPSLFLVDGTGTVVNSSYGFSKYDLNEMGERLGAVPFRSGESIPEFKPG